jgi:glycosyltransferase involved in cell wall biosynthesis/SAM-dependent methyltransferase
MGRGAPTAAAYFDRAAAAYGADRYGRGARPFRRAFFGTRLRLAARALADLPPGALVLDAGCGPSPLAPALRERGVRVLGLDLAPAMLARAREAGALPVRGDAAALPVRDGRADAVLLLGVTTYAADPGPLLREAARALRPGGILVVTATNAGAPDTLARALLRPLARLLGRSGDGVLASGVAVHAHPPGAFAAAIRDAGLEVTAARGHNFTLFPLGLLLEVPSVDLSRAAEAAGLPAGLASDTLFVARRPGGPPAAPRPRPARPVPVLRAIARLNVGGPAMHVALLSAGLDRRGFRTTLAAGRCEPGEADMSDFARERGVTPVTVRALGRSVSPVADLRSFADLLALVRRIRPVVVHTHTAKAGALGRVAALLAGVPIRVHTFHGHVFHGYFGRGATALVLLAERLLGLLSHRVLAVSPEVARDLGLAYGVVPPGKIAVVPLGLDLEPFARAGAGEGRGALRAEIGAAPEDLLVGVVGRLVPVKGHEFLLDAAADLLREIPQARIVIVGSGPLEEPLRARARTLGIDGRCHFLGWRRDTAAICADLDAVALTSRNEGTPVALIEAAAAGVPVVARSVGGVASALEGVEGATLVPPEAPPAGFAASLAAALRAVRGPRRPDLAVVRRFSVERLCDDVERIYREELARAGGRR